jgi:hypothetical protein
MMSHECDILVLTQSGYAYEVEIKISASDLKADLKKQHHHRSNKIKMLYFAIPKYLEPYKEFIPTTAGIMVVERIFDDTRICGEPEYKSTGWRDTMTVIRAPHVNREASKWEDKDRLELMRLSTMRIWSLKEKCQRLQRENKKYFKPKLEN